MEARLLTRMANALSIVAIGLAASLAACNALRAADWPMVNRDASNSRSSADSSIAPSDVGRLKPVKTLTAAGDVHATPVVAGGAVFYVDGGGRLSAANIKSGEVLWSRSIAEYDGIAGSVVRGSPVLVDGMIIFGDRNGAHVVAADAATGARKWIKQIDQHPAALITGSPIVAGGRLFVGVSALEGAKIIADRNYKSTFRGSMVALDPNDGRILWKTFTMPEGEGWSGGAIISVAAADPQKGLVYFGTDHQYTQPASVLNCLDGVRDDWKASCWPADARFNSLTAVDIETGAPRWTFRGFGADVWKMACGEIPNAAFPFPTTSSGKPAAARYCPAPGDYLNWAFAAGSPQLFTVTVGGKVRDAVAIAQKSGILWLLDADTGDVIWHAQIGPYSEPGGLTWGSAYDGERLYVTLTNLDHVPYMLAAGKDAGKLVSGGVWSALDPATGKMLWQTGDPQNAAAYAAPMVSNGVVYAGSMAATGDQMYALDAGTGEILWRFAAGSSVASHPAIADGKLFWGSGFGQFTGASGNKLFVFTVDGK